MRRNATLVIALALVAAACGGGGQAGGDGNGDGNGASGPVKIGLLYTVSGTGGDLAQSALGSAALAAEDGSARGIEVEIVDRDYAGKPSAALRHAEALAEEGVAGIVVASDDPELAKSLAPFEDVPLVYSLISDDAAVSADLPHFRMTPSNSLQAETLAEFLVEERGVERVAIVHDSSRFGRDGADAAEDALFDLRADVVARVEFKARKDVSTPVTFAGQEGAQAVIVWTEDTGEAARITIEAHRTNQSYQLALSGNLATARYGKNASSQVVPTAFVEGILSVGTWAGPWFDLDRMQGFYERFQKTNNAFAPVQAVQIYDAVLLLAEAAGQAGGDSASRVVSAIEGIRGFEGAGVPVTFGPTDHEGIDPEDMAILAFTKNQDAAGGEFAPEVDTGGGFFTIDTISVRLPRELSYLLEGLPE